MRLYEIKHFDLPEGYQDMNFNFSSTVSQELPHIKNDWIKEKWFVSLNDWRSLCKYEFPNYMIESPDFY